MSRIDLNMEYNHRRQIDTLHRAHKHELSKIITPHLYKHNQITEENYSKWLLDETGEYIPPLIKEKL